MAGQGLYNLWKIEKAVWLNGPHACSAHIMNEAILAMPSPFPIVRMSDMDAMAGRARPFESVELTERNYIDLGQSIVIAYIAIAKHDRFRRSYRAKCSTVYHATDQGWKIAAHQHAVES